MRSDTSVYWVLAGLSLSTMVVLCAVASVLLRIWIHFCAGGNDVWPNESL